MLNIKFGPYADQVPVSWMAGRLRQRLQSRKRGAEKLGYMRGSLSVLLEGLLEDLRKRGVSFVANARVERMERAGGRIEKVATTQGAFSADDVLITTPTTVVARLVEPLLPDYAADLRKIEHFGAICVVLELTRPLSSIYWLNVADPGFPFGGIIEHTNLVPSSAYGGSHIVYLSRYFAAADPLATASEADMRATMLEPLRRIAPGFSSEIIRGAQVFRTLTAAVVCGRNFSRVVPRCRTPIENLFLANMTHVYPDERSCNNSIRVAAEACRVMGLDSAMVPEGASLSGKIGME
jgi:protoporphyrinogen oxidase